MKIFLTGAAGFIGSNLCDRLLADGHEVLAWDNFSTGQPGFLEEASRNPNFCLLRGDNLDRQALTAGMAGCEMVFHLAANADVRGGLDHPEKDLQQNTIATFQLHDQTAFASIFSHAIMPLVSIKSILRQRSAKIIASRLHYAPALMRLISSDKSSMRYLR